jgi:hypothetical protein
MKRPDFSRRALLQGLGAATAAMPFSGMFQKSFAQSGPPLRFLAFFTPHGTVNEYWRPQGTSETAFTLNYTNSMLSPLETLKNQLLILDGLDYRILYEKKETGHEGGLVTFLTGSGCLNSGEATVPENESIDQFLANQLGQTTPFKSLELGIYKPAGDSSFTTMCYGPGGRRLPNQIDPLQVYQRVFANFAAPTTGEAERLLLKRKSVLDFVKADVGRMQNKLAGTERQKLEQHLDGLRNIEKRLVTPISTAGCTLPAKPGALDPESVDNIPAITKIQMDLIIESFACDLTRFASLQALWCGSTLSMPWEPGLNKDIHTVVHTQNEPGTAGTQARIEAAQSHRWWSKQFAYLLQRLAAIPEGNGSLLDNTVILWGNEMGDPAVHDNVNIPLVLAGGKNAGLRLGRWLRYSQTDNPSCENLGCSTANKFTQQNAHNALLVSICRAFGIQRDTYGDPMFPGALANLT